MKIKSSSFTTKFILRSIIVIVGIFIIIYFLFNQVVNNFIIHSTENELSLRVRNDDATHIAVLGNGWRSSTIEDAMGRYLEISPGTLTIESIPLAVVRDSSIENDNYVIVTERGFILASGNILHQNLELIAHEGRLVDKRSFIGQLYRENPRQFTEGEITEVKIGNRMFHVYSLPTRVWEDQEFLAPSAPMSILLYADVTYILDFKTTINTILIVSLSIAAVIILATTIRMSARFQQATSRLSKYAQSIGTGNFDAKIDTFKYREFQDLANNMSEMSTMLATYEVNQKQFFQNASHELRTPLMSVQCYSEGIIADVFEPNDAAIIINSEIEKMTELVASILYLSRIDHHTFKLRRTSTNEFLTECYNQIKILSNNNNIDLKLNLLITDLPINIDFELFERAVLNILSNALRYAQTEIIISAERYLYRNIFMNIRQERIKISIFNNGTHVKEDDLPHLFERFYKGTGGNTGLGLSITKEIVNALKGTIIVENVEFGVRFIIDIPAATTQTNFS